MINDKEESSGFKELFFKYKRYWPIILFSVIFCLGIAYLTNKLSTPLYKVESKILINDESKNVLLDLTGRGSGGKIRDVEQTLSNESIILRSRPLAKDVLSNLNFDVEYFYEDAYRKSEIYRKTPIHIEIDWKHPQIINGFIKISWVNNKFFNLTFLDDEYKHFVPNEENFKILEKPYIDKEFSFGKWVEMPYTKFKVSLTGAESMGELVVKFKDLESLINHYTSDNLWVYPLEKSSSILGLTLITNQPEKGKDYLNNLMHVFIKKELEEKNRKAKKTVKFIDNQISGVSDSLIFIENKLEQFRSNNRTYNISNEGSAIYNQLSDLDRSLSQAKFKKDYYQNLQDYLLKENYSEIIVPSGLGIEDPILNTLIENLIDLQTEKSRLMATQTESSPTVREVNRKIQDLNSSLREVLKNVNLNASILIKDLQDRISKIDRNFSKLPQTEQNLLRIEREHTLNESIYTFLLQRRAESAISTASNTASNKIIDDAVLNYIPIYPKPLHNYLTAVIAGLAIPLSILFLINLLYVKIKDIKEVEKNLKIPVLVRIGRNKRNTDMVVLNEANAGITESFRSLRSNINYIVPKDHTITIMLTSSISSEGKSFCSFNLASVYALSGKKTILIGCDMRKTKSFEGINNNSAGLSTYLSGQIDIFNIISNTQNEFLEIILPGPVPPNPSELLNNTRFEKLIQDLKKYYDIIIIDTPPIGLVSEALDILQYADITLFVLRYKYSRKDFIEHINSLKVNKGVKNLYVIINDIEDKELGNRGYGYGYYAEDNKNRSFLNKMFNGSNKAAI